MPQASSKTFKFESQESINPGLLEVIDFSGKDPQKIVYDYPEFSAVCPFSGLPDIARVVITFVPSSKIPELRQLKYYFLSFRNVGIYQEEATDRIFKDLNKIFEPLYLKVQTIYNIRGGLLTSATTEKGDLEDSLARTI